MKRHEKNDGGIQDVEVVAEEPKEQPVGIEGTELEELYQEAYMARWIPDKIDKYRKLMTREDEILN